MNNPVLLNQDAGEPCPACSTTATPPQNLYAELCSHQTLVGATRAVFASILRSPEDVEVVEQIETRLALFLDELEMEISECRYKVGVVLRGWRTQEGRLWRTRLLSLKDRVVRTALFMVLERVLKCSFADGDLQGRQQKHVLAEIHEIVCSGSSGHDAFSIESDGGQSNDLHLELLRMVARHVQDNALQELVKTFMEAPAFDTRSDSLIRKSVWGEP